MPENKIDQVIENISLMGATIIGLGMLSLTSASAQGSAIGVAAMKHLIDALDLTDQQRDLIAKEIVTYFVNAGNAPETTSIIKSLVNTGKELEN